GSAPAPAARPLDSGTRTLGRRSEPDPTELRKRVRTLKLSANVFIHRTISESKPQQSKYLLSISDGPLSHNSLISHTESVHECSYELKRCLPQKTCCLHVKIQFPVTAVTDARNLQFLPFGIFILIGRLIPAPSVFHAWIQFHSIAKICLHSEG
ncbi:hypothetical protein GOODEAATRI_004733, partial [Goodea atripinnis]